MSGPSQLPPPPPSTGGEGEQQQQQNFTSASQDHPLAAPPMPPATAPGAVPAYPSATTSPSQSVEVSLPSSQPPQQQHQYQQPDSQQQQLQQQQQYYHQPMSPPRQMQQQQEQQSQQQQQQYMTSPHLPPQAQQFSFPPAAAAAAATAPPQVPQPTTTVSNINTPTRPGQVQSLDELVDAFLSGPSYRTTEQHLPPLLRPPPLINENPLQCLRTLVERRAWGDVLQVTADLLRGHESTPAQIYQTMLVTVNQEGSDASSSGAVAPSTASTNTTNTRDALQYSKQDRDETVEIVALQCHAWLKLRRYSDLGQEVARWNILPSSDQYDSDTAPTWVPWSLHIIAAESFLYSTDDPYRGTDELHAVVSLIDDNSDEGARWKLCAHRALANAFSRKREWRMAMMSLERMLPLVETATRVELADSNSATASVPGAQILLQAAYQTEILSVQGRYLLHAGAVAEAASLFQTAKFDWEKATTDAGKTAAFALEKHRAVQHAPAQVLVNDGLLCFAYANYDQSIECFKNATDRLRSSGLSADYQKEDWVGPAVLGVAPHASLFNECINNMAICALYTCRMPEAVSLMESLIREDPTAFLTERVAFNLCTLYELGCDTTASARKKRVLQLVAKRFFLHDVGPESFRIN